MDRRVWALWLGAIGIALIAIFYLMFWAPPGVRPAWGSTHETGRGELADYLTDTAGDWSNVYWILGGIGVLTVTFILVSVLGSASTAFALWRLRR